MSVDKIWVLAEVADGAPITTSLELISQARTMAGTVEAVAWGDATASVAGTLGEYGATTVHDVGDLGGALPGAPVASAIVAATAAGGRAACAGLPFGASVPASSSSPSASRSRMTFRGRKCSRCWRSTQRRRSTSCSKNLRYPEGDRSGFTRPWLSRNLIFEMVTSGNSCRSRVRTSPIDRYVRLLTRSPPPGTPA